MDNQNPGANSPPPQQASPQAPAVAKKRVSPWVKLFAFFIIISMIGWVLAAYVTGLDLGGDKIQQKQDQNLIEVSGYSFYIMPDGTFTTVYETGGGQIPIQFRLDPREADNISIDDTSVSTIINAKKIYITSNPNQPDLGKLAVASAEVSRITGLYSIETIPTFTEDSDPPNPSVPLKNCEDADAATKTVVIYVHLDNSTGVRNENGCIHVTGDTSDSMILAADKLGYNLIGIKL